MNIKEGKEYKRVVNRRGKQEEKHRFEMLVVFSSNGRMVWLLAWFRYYKCYLSLFIHHFESRPITDKPLF